MNDALVLFAALLYGACIGSFLNVCIFRLPRRCLRLWKPKLSFCPKCRRTIAWYDNLPVLAFLILRGRCRGCKARIPTRYFFVELATAALFVYLAHRFIVLPGREDLPRRFAEAGVYAVLGAALIVCAAVDVDHRIIPDEIDVPGFLLAPIVLFFVPRILLVRAPELGDPTLRFLLRAPDLVGDATSLRVSLESALPWWGAPAWLVHGATWPLAGIEALRTSAHEEAVRAAFASLLGVAVGGGVIFAIGWLGDRLFKSPDGAMGFGDVKFMAMLGGFTGWQGVVGTVALASMVGAVWGLFSKFSTGTRSVTGRQLAETSPLGYLGLRLFGAPREAPEDQPVQLWPGGWLAAKFATGEPYLPFGPFLALGAFLIALWPGEVVRFFLWLGSHIRLF